MIPRYLNPASRSGPRHARLAALAPRGGLLRERSGSQDITDNYHDLQAQLQALQATRAQLTAIMRRARTIPDAMTVLDRLTDVNTSIDGVQGQIMAGANSVKFSTITANIAAQPRPPQEATTAGTGTVLMLAPGSGLGGAYIGRDGLPLTGDTLAGMEAGHMPAPLHLLGVPAYPCGCGRDWGCIEVYTTLSGLPHLLGAKLAENPRHELARSPLLREHLALGGLRAVRGRTWERALARLADGYRLALAGTGASAGAASHRAA